MLAKHAAIVPLSRWTDLSKKVLASESDLRDVLGQVALREGIHLDLARTANRYSDASHGLSLHAPHRQRDELKAQVFHAF